MNILKGKTIVLGSQSPRRKELLDKMDIPCVVRPSNVEEDYPSDLKKERITEYLALKKANYYSSVADNEIILTSDTIVWKKKALEKPKDRKEAIAMLRLLSGKKHQVITSVCLRSQNKTRIFTAKAEVRLVKLTKSEIKYYVDTYRPYDKAGGYGIQEWLGYVAVEEIKGTFSTIMGLPTALLYKELKLFVKEKSK